MAEFEFTKESIKHSTLGRNVFVRSKAKWKSSSETIDSPTNSNDMQSLSADDATSESDFDEHPYSISKRVKTDFNYCRNSNPIHATSNTFKEVKFEDKEDSSCWASSNVDNEIYKTSSKTRRKRSKCESKNAVMARLNRLKKKKYVEDLEARNAKLEAENKSLKITLVKRLNETLSLKRETANLRSVIKNSTEIGSLLQCVQKNTNLHVTSSILRNGTESELQYHSNKFMSDRNTGASQSAMDELSNNDEGIPNELNLFHCMKQSSLIKSNPTCLSSENPPIDDTCDLNLSINPSDDDFLCDFKGEVNEVDSNSFSFANTPSIAESTVTVIDENELVRCETPSKDIDINVSNNDFLFDDVGVCFHIANKRVSLEFCDFCNHKAGHFELSV